MRSSVDVISERKFGSVLILTTVTNLEDIASILVAVTGNLRILLNEEFINTGNWLYIRGNMGLNYGEFSRWDM